MVQLLVVRYETALDTAKALVNAYFSLDVAPLERALVMHRPAEEVAQELARISREQVPGRSGSR